MRDKKKNVFTYNKHTVNVICINIFTNYLGTQIVWNVTVINCLIVRKRRPYRMYKAFVIRIGTDISIRK